MSVKMSHGDATWNLSINDVVMLVNDNPFFNHMLGWVKEVTDFGAVVELESHDYPNRKKWTLRCVHSEMIYIGNFDRNSVPTTQRKEVVYNDGHKSIAHDLQQHQYEVVERKPETTGEVCKCGGLMVRTGTCMTCQACGNSSGGCS